MNTEASKPEQICWAEREEGFYPVFKPRPGYSVTQAFILCKYCNDTIYPCMGPRTDAVCFKCFDLDPDL